MTLHPFLHLVNVYPQDNYSISYRFPSCLPKDAGRHRPHPPYMNLASDHGFLESAVDGKPVRARDRLGTGQVHPTEDTHRLQLKL